MYIFNLQVIPGCPYCDEAIAHFPGMLPKKCVGDKFEVHCLTKEEINGAELAGKDVKFPILTCLKVGDYGDMTYISKITGAMYKKDIEDFIAKNVKEDE